MHRDPNNEVAKMRRPIQTRTCPGCGATWYSAASNTAWICIYCESEIPIPKIQQQPDVIVNDFDAIFTMLLARVPIIAIYKNPTDYPNKYVARLWDLDKPTQYIVLRDDLNDLRQRAIPRGMHKFMRAECDAPALVETWL